MILGYEKKGALRNPKAEKVIILHDWFSDHSSYDPCLPYFDQDNYKYAFLDLRGYGLSKGHAGQYTLAEVAQDIIDTADHLGWPQFHLVGHSMSALMGQFICALASQRIKSFIAVTPVGATGTPGVTPEILGFMTAAATDNDEFAAQAVHMMTDNRYGKTWADFKVRNWRQTSIVEARVGDMHLFLNSDILEEVKGLEVPMAVIFGNRDAEAYRRPIIEKTFAKWFPKCELFEIDNTGHYPMQETPVAFATTLIPFLDKHLG